MRCPFCGSNSDKVVDSRSVQDDRGVRRRRECIQCGRRFTTYEFVEETQLMVLKKDGNREPFDINKIIAGMRLACKKRPVPEDTILQIAEDIETELVEKGLAEIASADIGDIVMNRLRDVDEVAFVRFASVYRQFKDVEEFKAELNALLNKNSNI